MRRLRNSRASAAAAIAQVRSRAAHYARVGSRSTLRPGDGGAAAASRPAASRRKRRRRKRRRRKRRRRKRRRRGGGGDGGVNVRSPRPGGLLRRYLRDWSGHAARLGSRVGRVGRYDRAAAPHMRVGPRGRALSRVQRGRRSGARLAPAVLTPRRRRGTDRGRLYFFSETPGISHH